jgi:hypothetical protein
MAAPFNDILINPPRSDRRIIPGFVTTETGPTYGMCMMYDTGTTNFRDVKRTTGAGVASVAGVVADHGDPNNSGQFSTGDDMGLCVDGIVEVLLDGGQTATKGAYAISGATAGTVKPIGGESAPYSIVGQFMETLTAGASPTLVSLRMGLHHRQA